MLAARRIAFYSSFSTMPGRFFCHACIGRRLELNIGTVQKAAWELRASADIRVDDAPCSKCGQQRLVVGREDGRTPPR